MQKSTSRHLGTGQSMLAARSHSLVNADMTLTHDPQHLLLHSAHHCTQLENLRLTRYGMR